VAQHPLNLLGFWTGLERSVQAGGEFGRLRSGGLLPSARLEEASMISGAYHGLVVSLLERIERTQAAPLAEAARAIKRALDGGGVVHAFSTGHSHMMVEEMFYRAGGLVPVNAIFDPGTMLHQGASRSTRFERLSGYAEAVLHDVETRPGEPMVLISNSGINPVPVEMALLARARGLVVIAITSCSLSQQLEPRHSSGKRLLDLADIVLDNCIEGSDAAVEIPPSGMRVGALSSIAGIYLVQRLALSVIDEYLRAGELPPIFASSNVPGGDEWNQGLVEKYRGRIRGL
jgi:uncharacterized phosphosugar-binding protein